MKRKPSPAVAIGLVALFFSLTGAGFAASRYIITSTSQIKPSVRQALKGEQGARGPRGTQGPAGSQGPAGGSQGTASVANATVVVAHATLSPFAPAATAEAICPTGEYVINGGFTGGGEIVTANFAKAANTWIVAAHLDPTASGGSIEAWARCA